jgi:hypothetical protein
MTALQIIERVGEVSKGTLPILQVIIYLGGIFLAWRFFMHFSPRIELQLSPQWIPANENICILKIKVTDISKIRVRKRKVHLQVLFHPLAQIGSLSEWVPFRKKDIRPGEEPESWSEPTKVLSSTKVFFPGEATTVDYPIVFPKGLFVAHVGLQLCAKLNFWERILSTTKRQEQWTTTIFIWPPTQNEEAAAHQLLSARVVSESSP